MLQARLNFPGNTIIFEIIETKPIGKGRLTGMQYCESDIYKSMEIELKRFMHRSGSLQPIIL